MTWVDEALHAPNGLAFVKALLTVYKPQFLQAYRGYLEIADAIADGPSIRFLKAAVEDKQAQLDELQGLVADLETIATPEERQAAEDWTAGLLKALRRRSARSRWKRRTRSPPPSNCLPASRLSSPRFRRGTRASTAAGSTGPT